MITLVTLLSPILLLLVSDGERQKLPAALEAAIQRRAADVIRTARIDWSIREDAAAEFPGESVGVIPVVFTVFKSTVISGESLRGFAHGTEDQIRQRLQVAAGDEVPVQLRPSWQVAHDGVVWERRDGEHGARIEPLYWGKVPRLADPRRIGMDPIGSFQLPHERLAGMNVRFTEREEDGLIVVSAEIEDSAFRWWIDPQRDHAITAMANIIRGREATRTEIELEQIDGIWFPVRAALHRYAVGDRPGRRASVVYEVHHAEFNRPEHAAAAFVPADIGIDIGTSIYSQVKGRPGGFYDGKTILSPETYFERIGDGTLQRGERSQRVFEARREVGAPPPWQSERAGEAAAWPESVINRTAPAFRNPLGDHETRWRAYVRRFIARHKLDDAQSRRANEVLKDCEERANRYLATRKTELDDLREALQRPSAQRDGDKIDLREGLAERVDSLSKPIDEIFEGVLKPRLDGLLTTAQRERKK